MNTKRTIILVLLTLMLVAVTACRGAGAQTDIPDVTFTAKDHSFSGPDTIPAGWVRVHLNNEGPDYDHIQFVRLTEGKTIDDLTAALGQSPEWPAWIEMYGGPNAPDPGATSTATVRLDPGNYVILSWIPDKDGTPHFAKGMIKPVTVTDADEGGQTEPAADVTMEFHDFSYSLSGSLAAGEQTVRVNNEGSHPHEVWVAKLAQGKTVEDLFASLAPDAPPEAWDTSGIGGITEIEPGAHAYFTLDLEPGHYALLCFVFDQDEGTPHAAMGMVQEFDVQ